MLAAADMSTGVGARSHAPAPPETLGFPRMILRHADARTAYLHTADNVSGPLAIPLREVNQPVRSTRNRFSGPRQPCGATSNAAVAMAAPEKATLLAGSRHDR